MRSASSLTPDLPDDSAGTIPTGFQSGQVYGGSVQVADASGATATLSAGARALPGLAPEGFSISDVLEGVAPLIPPEVAILMGGLLTWGNIGQNIQDQVTGPYADPGYDGSAPTQGNSTQLPSTGPISGPITMQVGGDTSITGDRVTHILDSDADGGGHRYGTGIPNKSEFPSHWSDEDVIKNILDVANDPASARGPQERNGYYPVTGTREGVDIRVIVDPTTNTVRTAYPTNTQRNPKK